eukprot:CAMPEP_0183308894 /NCGR_PEP_ID=MMETSP0160_2-20130417/22874_1 /TAXON_ID=2839 ORGANISM="Odontella Sinensis, Strain Grunow 1884" /NCGR_SAMPLE_ID=MMETSP0160_2 /ASSEMBLY_ACC=CAM_ASM_000250 /LENGTH=272 /DNA_ID=CAMNT_0025472809 /DNA_START=63 /DNA_END=878 /DNA_ORIENTATION=+
MAAISIMEKFTAWIDGATGIEGTVGYLLVILCVIVGHTWINGRSGDSDQPQESVEEEDEAEPPRNFTAAQLKYFDGKPDPKTEETKPVYLSVNGIVFDVSEGRNFYGPGGPYELFAGHECGVALAKMSFDTTHIDDLKGCQSLNFGEKNELDGWIEKFQYWRGYQVKGRLVPDDALPAAERIITKEELEKNDGTGDTPEGYATAPIYLAAQGKVFDVSFGGVTFYGEGGSYNRFAGKDASRALAKMSFDPEDTINTDTSDLTEKEKKVLNDW